MAETERDTITFGSLNGDDTNTQSISLGELRRPPACMKTAEHLYVERLLMRSLMLTICISNKRHIHPTFAQENTGANN